eukprot:COSAG06_NODE_3298_length_5538_cov_3.853833_6_plen_175_part_00
MNDMFNGASAFNCDLSAWDVSAVQDMGSMFYGASAFSNLSAWDVSAVQDMGSMFYGASAFNSNLSAWDVSAVHDMGSMFERMFAEASAFNGQDCILCFRRHIAKGCIGGGHSHHNSHKCHRLDPGVRSRTRTGASPAAACARGQRAQGGTLLATWYGGSQTGGQPRTRSPGRAQ